MIPNHLKKEVKLTPKMLFVLNTHDTSVGVRDMRAVMHQPFSQTLKELINIRITYPLLGVIPCPLHSPVGCICP